MVLEPKPYCYILYVPRLGGFYIGARSRNIRDDRIWEEDLLIWYFTSSERIEPIVRQFGAEIVDVFECETVDLAHEVESYAIHEFEKCNLCVLNGHNAGKNFRTAGRIKITNGLRETYIFESEQIPEGWYPGRKNSTLKSMSSSAKNKIFITNGVSTKWHDPSFDIPDGWTKGRTISKKQRAGILERNKAKGGWFYINNGTISRFHNPDLPIPPGWVKGRYFKSNTREVGSIYITDGRMNRIIPPGEEIPEGFRRGRCKI